MLINIQQIIFILFTVFFNNQIINAIYQLKVNIENQNKGKKEEK